MPAELATSLTSTDAERLEQAEGLVRSFCRWHIAPSRAATVTLRGTGSATLALPSLHVTDIESVTQDGTLLAEDDDYTWSTAGVLTSTSTWGTDEVVVVFTHGHADVPPEVAAIVQAVAQRAVDNPGSKPRAQDGPFSDTFSQSGFNQAPALHLLDGEKAALSHYRIVTVA